MRKNMGTLNKILNENCCRIEYFIAHFDGSRLLGEKAASFDEDSGLQSTLIGERESWSIDTEILEKQEQKGIYHFKVKFTLDRGESLQTSVGIRLAFGDWLRENYVMMPAAAYNGNRFEVREMSYPPQLFDARDLRTDIPTLISDVPRLNIGAGPSRLQQLTGDLATPAMGFHAPRTRRGFWLLTTQSTLLGNSGLAVEESENRGEAYFEITAPGMRRDFKYTICNNKTPCDDHAADFHEGDSAELEFRLYFFDCSEVQELFDTFVDIRKDITGPVTLKHRLPFASSWGILEKKYNNYNWEEERGYYSVGGRENVYQDWQVGWVGGAMCTYVLLLEGSELSKKRALRNFDFLFAGGQAESGFFHGCGHQGLWYGDCYKDINKKWHLIRKSCDALYFLMKQLMLMKRLTEHGQCNINPKKEWLEGTRRCADAFVNLWNRYGQFGQYIDVETGEIIIGGSTSGGIAPAGLALAWQYFRKEEYIRTAEEAARYYYKHFVKKGLSTGGPGEIIQCPDSESAFGLLESFTVLYEVTSEPSWLEKAKEMANQCFTWCVSYDFEFPANSTFGKLDMRTAGSVYANVQNKHSAPGICTLSGDTLFKLYRYTGNMQYLELIREIAHNLPQYLSRDDRPIAGMNGSVMPAGWMSERVEMSDWLEPVGEIYYGSCWCEVSNMMAWAEIPGVYVQKDTGFVCAIDHVDVQVLSRENKSLVLRLTNPTEFPAEVKVFVENSQDMETILGQNAMLGCARIAIAPDSFTDLQI